MRSDEAPYAFEAFDPARASRADWDRYHAFRRSRHEEARPEDPVMPDDLVERTMVIANPFAEHERVAVLDGDRMVGWLDVEWLVETAPGFESNRKYLYAFGAVIADARRQGIGTRMARHVAVTMKARDKSVLTTGTEEEDGHAFLRWLGAEERQSGSENRLDMHEVDWDKVHDWIARGRASSPDTRLALYERRIPDTELDGYCPMFSRLLNAMPFDDVDRGEIVVTPEMMREMYRHFDVLDASHDVYVAREADGSLSGMTDVSYHPARPDRVQQRFTGVRPDCRGRGIGKWLKAEMLVRIRDAYPQARWVVTENATSNAAMLAINRALGFRAHRAGSTYQIGLETLAERVAGL